MWRKCIFPASAYAGVHQCLSCVCHVYSIHVVCTYIMYIFVDVCIHVRFAYIRTVNTCTLCIHTRCAHMCAVHTCTLCIHAHCARMHTVHTCTLHIHACCTYMHAAHTCALRICFLKFESDLSRLNFFLVRVKLTHFGV